MAPKTDNRSNGGRFEQELAERLAQNGFWAHVLQQNKSGQPADIIAVKDSFATLIDCKVISTDAGFVFERRRENQRYAMRKFYDRTGNHCFFALKYPSGKVYMLSHRRFLVREQGGRKCLSEEEAQDGWCETFEEWVKSVDSGIAETNKLIGEAMALRFGDDGK